MVRKQHEKEKDVPSMSPWDKHLLELLPDVCVSPKTALREWGDVMRKRSSVAIEKRRGAIGYEVVRYRRDGLGYSIGSVGTLTEAKQLKKQFLAKLKKRSDPAQRTNKLGRDVM